MNPNDLTVEQVRRELETLIVKYPDRTGRVELDGDYEDAMCVYYTDEDGVPVSLSSFDIPEEEPILVTPICIIGQWIEDFHPEFKQDSTIYKILKENSSLRAMSQDGIIFQDEVWTLLSDAQYAQDGSVTHWKDIVLNVTG